MSSEARYSIGTWDTNEEAFTPDSLSVPSFNITIGQLRQAMKELKSLGYSCHRIRDTDGSYDDNDPSVLIERTDGMTEAEILESWKR